MTAHLDAVVLAGGQSRRLGLDKALLRFGGAPLLRIVVDRVAEVSGHIVVAVDRPDRYRAMSLPATFVSDIAPGLGPLAGLQAGLRACGADHALVLACDHPFLSVKLLQYMVAQPRSYEALVPRFRGRWHPLHAIYARSCLAEVDALVDQGGGSMRDLLARLDVKRLGETELRRLDPHGLSLMNLNRGADVKRAQSMWPDFEKDRPAGP